MPNYPLPPKNTRLGFHYYPDTNHYRLSDLQTWLPELRTLGASWITLEASQDRAIPEHFLCGLTSAGIEPILKLSLSLEDSPSLKDLLLLFTTYARWGIHYILLFDRPNIRKSWGSTAWAQSGLVERFLDRFIPIAHAALHSGLTPIFPILEPGGDYWDISFLRAALEAIRRRAHKDLIDNLVLSAKACAGNRSLDWGIGGPERWPGLRPYFRPPNQEDHRGFRIFDWYLAISQAVIGKSMPIILFEAGSYSSRDSSNQTTPTIQESQHADRNFAILQALFNNNRQRGTVPVSAKDKPGPISKQVLAGNFWLLTSDNRHPSMGQAWFKPDGRTLPIVGAFRQWLGAQDNNVNFTGQQNSPPSDTTSTEASQNGAAQSFPIDHYVLLPLFEWGISDWYLDAIRPFVKKYRATIGFSLQEAAHAARVTVVGSRHLIPDSKLDELRRAGCIVERIDGDGMSVATKLASR